MTTWVTAEGKRYIVVSAARSIFLETMTNTAFSEEDLMYIQAACMNQCWESTNCDSLLLSPRALCLSFWTGRTRLVRSCISCITAAAEKGPGEMTPCVFCCLRRVLLYMSPPQQVSRGVSFQSEAAFAHLTWLDCATSRAPDQNWVLLLLHVAHNDLPMVFRT